MTTSAPLLDESAPQAAETLRHLEDCATCQDELAALSGEGPWLKKWLAAAQADSDSFRETQDYASSSQIVVLSDHGDDETAVRCEPTRLDFLQPPTHPELLGRLGRYDIERLIGKEVSASSSRRTIRS